MDERIRTYIRGLDEQMEGGIPKGHIVLIAGSPGTMKSSVAYSILYHNCKNEKKVGVYITLEQDEESLTTQMKHLGMDPKDVEENFSIVDLGTIRMKLAEEGREDKDWGQVLEGLIQKTKEKLGCDLLVIDSLAAFEFLLEYEISRTELFAFFEWMRNMNMTVFLIAEMRGEKEVFGKRYEGFLADGIIHLKFAQVSDVDVQRRIRCIKMRGTKHHTGFFNLLVDDRGFAVTKTITI